MATLQLTLASLAELDNGKIGVAFAHHLKKVLEDLNDRPLEDGVRKLSIQLLFKPQIGGGENGAPIENEGAYNEIQVTSSIPKHRSKTYHYRVNAKAQAAFSTESPDNANQLTFDDVDPVTGKAKKRPFADDEGDS